jgi:hypothetical protein
MDPGESRMQEQEVVATRRKDLRVPVHPHEEQAIQEHAARAGLKVATYLREVGMGYQITGIVDAEQVRELARVNGDLGRLGGLLKLWLTDDPRTARFGDTLIRAVLEKIEATQDEMTQVMRKVIRPKAGPGGGAGG